MSEKTNIDFHQDPNYQALVRSRLDAIKAQRQDRDYEDEEPGVLSGLAEAGGRKAKAALAGVFAVAALAGSADLIAQRIAAVVDPHQVTRTHVEENAQNPYDSNSHQTNTITYSQEVIGR